MKNNDKKENGGQEQLSPDKSAFRQILSYVETTDLEFVQLEKEGKKFSFRREISNNCAKNSIPNMIVKEAEPGVPQPVFIRSPIVGRFYRSTGADRPPLVVEGSHITAGQRVAIVEAMKIKKEVFSSVAGKISKILVRDGDPVEYGQELYSVESNQEEKPGAPV